MSELRKIYDHIMLLRQNGMLMKDIAATINFAPSVLSAICATVLPAYFENLERGIPDDEALDKALGWVNNVSRRKVLSLATELGRVIMGITIPDRKGDAHGEGRESPFLAMLGQAAIAQGQVLAHAGIYMSYSISSTSVAMKMEPYLIAPSPDMEHLLVMHRSVYGATHRGVAIPNGLSHLYLSFNENSMPHLALFNICLKLPMYDHPPFLRGLYMCLDYNYNPIARRILFVKRSEKCTEEAFADWHAFLKTDDQLTQEERHYYDYTCGADDVVRLCNVPSPRMTVEDLAEEKKLLRATPPLEKV